MATKKMRPAAERLLGQLESGAKLVRVSDFEIAPLYYLEQDGSRWVVHHLTVRSMLKAGTLVEGESKTTPLGAETVLHAAESTRA